MIVPRIFPKKAENVTLRYWLLWEDPAPYRALADEFTQKNPNIKVIFEKQDIKTVGKYIERLRARTGSANGPDLFRFHNSWLTEMRDLLAILPDDVVRALELNKGEGKASTYYPVTASDLNIDGAYYGAPISFDTLALFTNTQLFRNQGIAAYPDTWDDLVTAARSLTVVDSTTQKITTSGIALGTYDNITHAPDIISLLMVQNGADVTNLTGPTKKNAYQALEFYTSFAKGDQKMWDDTLENSTLAFAKGNVAMYIGYSWDIFQIKAINPELQFAVVPVPQVPDGREATIASYWVEGVAKKSKNQKAALEFLKYLASKSAMEKIYTQQSKARLFGELYPRSDMAILLKNNSIVYPFVQQGPVAASTIFSSDTHDEMLVDGLNKYLADAVRSIVNQDNSPESAIETLGKGFTQLVNQYAK